MRFQGWVCLTILTTVACGGSNDDGERASVDDAALDDVLPTGGRDTSPGDSIADAAPSPPVDASVDSSVDGARDAPTDAAIDAPIDAPAGWILSWSDEFDGSDGSAVDPTKWNYDVGNGEHGWGNDELEYYTSGTDNAVIRGGSLVITATDAGASKYKCWYGACKYVSARLTTSGKFSQKYGRFEARIKLPRGKGVWPAFWMLGQDFPGVSWPDCGEIDIMENIGSEPGTCHGTTHGPGPATYVDVGLTGATTLPSGKALSDDFHVFATEWEPNVVRFSFDGAIYKTVTPKDLPATAKWVWDHPFFILLNFAVGGSWPGSPDGTTKWPQTMEVDYVRAYRAAP